MEKEKTCYCEPKRENRQNYGIGQPVGWIGSVAQLERDTSIQRSRMGMVKSAKSGNILTGIPRYGYTYNREKLQYEVNEEAKVVREIFRLYIEQDSSLPKVTTRLNELGCRTRSSRKNEQKKFAYADEMRDNTKAVHPSKFEQKVNFVYN